MRSFANRRYAMSWAFLRRYLAAGLLLPFPTLTMAQSGVDLSKMTEDEIAAYTVSRIQEDNPADKIESLSKAVRSGNVRRVLAEVNDPVLNGLLAENKCFRDFVFGFGRGFESREERVEIDDRGERRTREITVQRQCNQVPGQLSLAEVFDGPYETALQLTYGNPDKVEVIVTPQGSRMKERADDEKRKAREGREGRESREIGDDEATIRAVNKLGRAARRRAQDTEYIVCRLNYRDGWEFIDNFCYFGTNGQVNRYAVN